MSLEKILYRLDQPHGSGTVNVSWRPGNSTHLATTGCDSKMSIFDRQGKCQDRFHLPGLCADFGWDSDGDVLAAISNGSSTITLWDAATGKKSQVDAGVRDALTCMAWARKQCLLAVGTQKGNLALYDHINAKRVPILGKHKKRIICAVWSAEGLLALAGEDRVLTISTADGDTRREVALQGDPSDIQFGEIKTDRRLGGENTVSLIMGKMTLFLYNILEPENPIELSFQKRYGPIVTHKWYGDGYILIGFEAGYLISISTHAKEVGQELFQTKNHRDCLSDIAINSAISKAVSCGDNNLKIHSLRNIEEVEKIITIAGEAAVNKIEWSADGSMIAVVTHSSNVIVYLVEIPRLTSVCGNKIGVLSSLSEVFVYSYMTDKSKPPPYIINTVVEPSIVAVGPTHAAVALNNRAMFWDFTAEPHSIASMPVERDYLATVESISLNETYISVLFDGQLHLHAIKSEQSDSNNKKDMRVFPDKGDDKISCHCLSSDFLVYGDDMGHIVYFSLEAFNQSNIYSHTSGIKKIFLDSNGTHLCFIDDKGDVYLYDPIKENITPVPDRPENSEGVVWEQNISERYMFLVYNNIIVTTYVFVKFHIEGVKIVKVGITKLPTDTFPLLMYSGEITLNSAGGKLVEVTLPSHEDVRTITDEKKIKELLEMQIICRRFNHAWESCKKLNDQLCWQSLGQYALANLNVEFAIRVYRHLEDAAMVWELQKLANIHEVNLLAGHICALLGRFDEAEQFFLNSSQPVEALYLRRDSMQWVQALDLAQNLKPSETPYIAKEYAQQLEFTGNYPKALVNYERGLVGGESSSNEDRHHRLQCLAGIARMSIRCGDTRKGLGIAMENDSPRTLRKDCAEILESMKQINEAAALYEKAEYYDKAASAYIKLRNWQKVGQLLPQISSPKINIQYAKAKESEKKFEEAAKAYEAAKDYENIIRINLEHLNNPARSVEIVQETKSIEGAKLVARHFQKMNDYNAAIKFLIMSNCHDEAFQLANQHSKMELYGEILVESLDSNSRKEDFKSLAIHFESQKNSFLAGKYYFHAKEYSKALKHLMKAAQLTSDDDLALSLAIDAVASSKNDKLANQLIDFLLGSEGLPKDPKYLFRLYMARKQYRDAAKTAIIIANEEQINGNYRNAHDVLFGMYKELKFNNIAVPSEMQNNMNLLHSYILVRLHVKRNDHLRGARMLIRVASNISKFPSHIVPILTSTVIECHRAGLKKSAFNFAAILMRPEYRTQIDAKYAKKIEAIVRKPPKSIDSKDEDPDLTPCPYCKSRIFETEVICDHCKNTIPFCIATGRHIVEEDFTACPQCDFPAIRSEFIRIIQSGEACPMCSERIDMENISINLNIQPYLHFSNAIEKA